MCAHSEHNYDIIILVNKPSLEIYDITQTIACACQQTLAPKTVNIVINIDGITDKDIIPLMDNMIRDRCEWTVDFLYPDKDGKRLDRLQAIDFIAKKSTATYYVVFNAGSFIPINLLANLSKAERFVLATPDAEGNGLVVHKNLHKMLFGNEPTVLERYNENEVLVGDDIVEKAQYVAEQNKQENLIKKIEDICPNFHTCQ